jgi:mediator of RNA polymerase II transcription subunit 5
MQRSLSLRDALRLEADRCREVQKRDVVMADIIVLLYKRVEQQMTLPQGMPDMNQMLNPNGGLDAGLGNDVSLDAVMQNMQNNGDATLDLGNADTGGLGLTGDLDGELGAGDAMDAFGADIPMGTGNDTEDIFGGLDTNLEGMDMDTINWGEGGIGI